MRDVNVGIVGLGNIGSGTLKILAENADHIALKLGFHLRVGAVCDLLIDSKQIPESLGPDFKTNDWRRLIAHPGLDIVLELVGGTTIALAVINAATAARRSVVTANKELMALSGPEIWERATQAGTNVAMEASVAGGIPIHTGLRECISGGPVV